MHYDVIIVGGGIIGLCSAFALREAGLSHILVVDRGLCGQGSTTKATGGIRTQFSSQTNVELAMRGRRYFRDWNTIYGGDPQFREVGYLFFTSDTARAKALQQGLARQRNWGVQVDQLEPSELAKMVPGLRIDDVVMAVWSSTDGIADPGAALASVESACRRRGVIIKEHTRVDSIVHESGTAVGVRAGTNLLTGDRVLLATGAWTAPLAEAVGFPLPISPHHRQVYRTAPLANWPRVMPLSVDLDTGLYCHSDGQAVIFGGGDRNTVAGLDETARPDQVTEIIDPLIRRWPRLADAELAQTWAGLREMTPDDHGIVGEIPTVKGLYVAAGFSGHGFMQAPAIGELVASMFTGQPGPIDGRALDPSRFSGEVEEESYVF